MEPTFTLATLFWLFVPMPLLVVFSLVSIFNQLAKEKKQKNAPPVAVDTKTHSNKKIAEKGDY